MNSTNAQRAELLDILVERRKKLTGENSGRPSAGNPILQPAVGLLLAYFLKTSHEAIAPDRLFDWLGLAALDPPDLLPSDDEPTISDWLSHHPEIQKAMIAACVETAGGQQRFDSFVECVSMQRSRLFNATPPPDSDPGVSNRQYTQPMIMRPSGISTRSLMPCITTNMTKG